MGIGKIISEAEGRELTQTILSDCTQLITRDKEGDTTPVLFRGKPMTSFVVVAMSEDESGMCAFKTDATMMANALATLVKAMAQRLNPAIAAYATIQALKDALPAGMVKELMAEVGSSDRSKTH